MVNYTNIVKYYLKELECQSELFKPGIFWEKALNEIAISYYRLGHENFRNDVLNLAFFVPTYGVPGNGFDKQMLENNVFNKLENCNEKQKSYIKKSFNGHFHALSDYRTFRASNSNVDKFNILEFSESIDGNPSEHFEFEGRYFSRSSLNYLLGLSFLKKYFPDFIPQTVLEIGGGFGTLGEILGKSKLKNFKYIDLDLPPIFLIAENYLKNTFKNNNLRFFDHYQNKEEKININELTDFTFLPNWKIENIEGKIDLFVNFISFQEMEPAIVKNYIKKIQKLEPYLVLLRNMREGKQLKRDGQVGVKEPIFTKNYLEYFSRYDLVASNVIPFGFSTVDGFNSELLLLKRK